MDWKSTVLLGSLFLFGCLETLFPFFASNESFIKRTATNFALGLLNAAITSVSVAIVLKWEWQHPLGIAPLGYIQLPWLSFILSFLILDAYMYAWHRFMHTNALGWRFHQVHHSDSAMNISTAYRFHTIEVVMSNIPKLLLIWFFGISPIHYLIYELTVTAELVFHHSNVALPYHLDKVLSYWVVTPNYHRFHHSQRREHSMTNYASMLSIWDKLFGTYQYPRAPRKLRLGLPKFNHKDNLVRLLTLPF